MKFETGLSQAGQHLGQHGLVLEEMSREQTGQIMERAVGQPLVWDLALR